MRSDGYELLQLSRKIICKTEIPPEKGGFIVDGIKMWRNENGIMELFHTHSLKMEAIEKAEIEARKKNFQNMENAIAIKMWRNKDRILEFCDLHSFEMQWPRDGYYIINNIHCISNQAGIWPISYATRIIFLLISKTILKKIKKCLQAFLL